MELLQQIMARADLSEEEVLHNLQVKKSEFQGLINDEAAARLIAKELGIFIEEEESGEFFNLADVQLAKPSETNSIVRVMGIYSPKSFETERKKGKVCNLEIADNTAKATLVLWDEDVRWMEKNGLERGDVLVLRGAQVKSYNPLELHSSLLTEILQLKPPEFAGSKYSRPLPLQVSRLADVKSLKEGDAADLFGRVTQMSEIREFNREGRIGRVLNLAIADASGTPITVVLWGYHAEHANYGLKPGMAMKIEGGQVKKSPSGLELHLNWASNLIIEPKAHNLLKEEELLSNTLPTVRILDLKAGERGIVKAYLSKIDKVEMESGILHVQAQIRDEIGVPVHFHGRRALEILQLRNLPKVPLGLVLKLKEEYIKGKRVSLVARKEKDPTGKVAKYYCEHVMHFV
ncbi:MAG: hypothetical protein ABH863_01810 [Candidatus Micrarchaeota archaeon]